MTYEEKLEMKKLIAEVLQEYLRDAVLRSKPIKLKSNITNNKACPHCGGDISEVVASMAKDRGKKGGKGCSEAKRAAIKANLAKAHAARKQKQQNQ